MSTSAGKDCNGPYHHYFVAETVGVPSDGAVHVIALCTDCGEAILRSFTVTKPFTDIQLGNNQKKEK